MAGKNFHCLSLTEEMSTGILKCSFQTWNKCMYKLSREMVQIHKDDERFQRSGLYFLFVPYKVSTLAIDSDKGEYLLSVRPSVYIGQAIYREDKQQGILYRVDEKHPNSRAWDDSWTDAIILVSESSQSNIEQNELDYLENKFWNTAKDCNRFDVLNVNKPSCSPVSVDYRDSFDVDFDNARIILNVFGFKAFEPKNRNGLVEYTEEEIAVKTERAKRPPFSFGKCGIPVGSEIYFQNDPNIVATVVDDKHIEYNGVIGSVSKFAREILHSNYDVQGTLYWYYAGESLDELRKEREQAGLYI